MMMRREIRLPPYFSVDLLGRLHIGCVTCNYREAVVHECNGDCISHPVLDKMFIQPLRLLYHNEHD